jgi:N4-gp56 family major capsid protein
MALQTTTNLSNSIRAMYGATYLEAAMRTRLYDQFSTGIEQYNVETAARMGSSVVLPFLSVLPIATAVISQSTDITPRAFRDATVSITPTSRADAIQWAEAVDIQAFTNYGESRFAAIGEQQMRSVDWLAMTAALQGSLVQRAAARASLDAGTSGHRLSDSVISEVDAMLRTLRCPYMLDGNRQMWMALMHPAAFHDLRVGGNVVSVGQYQNGRILLNFELGEIGPFKLIVSGDSKVFGAAGADNASNVDTTIAASLGGSANQALGTTIEVASATNITDGDWLTIGTEETGNTFDDVMERVKYVSTSSTTITIVGSGPNGGLLNDHPVGSPVRNADSVYPTLFGSPYSLVKLYDAPTGEYGMPVGPEEGGLVRQFRSLGWKFYGGYGRSRENCLVRGEFSSSLEA